MSFGNERRVRAGLGGLFVAAAVGVAPAPALASTGTIAFVRADGYQVPFTIDPFSEAPVAPEIELVDAAGGRARRLLRMPADAPAWSPDGTRLAFAPAYPSKSGGRILVSRADGSRRRAVTRASRDALYEDPAWSPDGSRLVFVSELQGLRIAPAAGGRMRTLTSDASDMQPAWNVDGRIAFARFHEGHWRIFTIGAEGGRVSRLTSGDFDDRSPSWSPDGTRIAFARQSADRADIFVARADGADAHPVTAAGPDEANRHPAWSPDGSALAFSAWGPFGNDSELMALDLGTGVTRRLTDNLGDDGWPAWRPAAPGATASRKPRPLRGRRRPPRGLVRWIRQPQEGDGSLCHRLGEFAPSGPTLTFHTHQSPGEVTHAGRQEVGTRGFVCAYNFRGLPRATLRLAGGAPVRLRMSVGGRGTHIAYWVARRGTEGPAEVVASRASRSDAMTFRVVPPDTPHLVVLDRRERSAVVRKRGRPVPILLTGLRPRARAWLDLYRSGVRRPRRCRGCPPGEFGHRYFNSVRFRARADGTYLYRLRTARGDPPGGYAVMLRIGRRQHSGAEFWLER